MFYFTRNHAVLVQCHKSVKSVRWVQKVCGGKVVKWNSEGVIMPIGDNGNAEKMNWWIQNFFISSVRQRQTDRPSKSWQGCSVLIILMASRRKSAYVFLSEIMAACKAKSVQRRVEGSNSGYEVNPTMHEMVLSAIRGCRDPTGMIRPTVLSLIFNTINSSRT